MGPRSQLFIQTVYSQAVVGACWGPGQLSFKLGVQLLPTSLGGGFNLTSFENGMKKIPGECSRADPSLFQEGTRTLTDTSQPALCVPSHVEEERGSAGVYWKCSTASQVNSQMPRLRNYKSQCDWACGFVVQCLPSMLQAWVPFPEL